jgi:uncharacterized RDD family membrane protein YckC
MIAIWVDRAGIGYGPYTADEFLAYVDSGHIVPTDRARIGDRGDFEPVPTVLARLSGLPVAAELPNAATDQRDAAPGLAPVSASTADDAGQPAGADSGPRAAIDVESRAPVAGGAATLDLAPGALAAGFWRRAGAYAIDFVLGYALAWILSTLVGLGASLVLDGEVGSATIDVIQAIPGVLLLTLWPLYFAWAESSSAQATFGKRAMGLIVTDRHGQRLSFLRALGRHIAALANYASLMVGWIFVAVPEQKRGFHDHLAGSRVLCATRDARSPWIGFAIWLLVAIGLLGLLAGGHGALMF